MNIAFFLIPKEDVVYLAASASMQQALEELGHHRYTALPVLDGEGKYVGTLTEGDLFWKMKNTPGLTFENTAKVPLSDVPRGFINSPVRIDAEIEDLLALAIEQNFVPVVDDNENFIGIIRRREIIEYFSKPGKSNRPE